METDRTAWQRARRPEQKLQRRDAILDAARALLDRDGLEGTGINAIAREAGLSKPAIYTYFDSREAILLDLLSDEYADWIGELAERVPNEAAPQDIEALARVIASSLSTRLSLCVLIGSVSSVLEHNVEPETVAEFKRAIYAHRPRVLGLLQTVMPGLGEHHADAFMLLVVLLAGALWPASHPSPVVAEVLERPEFAPYACAFEPHLTTFCATYLRGLRDGSRG
ncbi:MAG: TetR/AcrR family transcriptional regulator [Planctomycetota bacterium]